MYKKKRIIAVIPARKNSKGIKNKNLINLNGLPLISYSIDYDTIMPDHAVVHTIDYVKKILKYNFDYVVFLQPTTPLRQLGELDKAIRYCVSNKFDTVFSSMDYKPFLWRRKRQSIYPVSFDPYKRKRRQIIQDINETGSYYITKKEAFKKFRNRFGKKISNYTSDILSSFEIDTLGEYDFVNELFKTSILKKHKISLPYKKK